MAEKGEIKKAQQSVIQVVCNTECVVQKYLFRGGTSVRFLCFLIHLLSLNTVMFSRKYSLGQIQYQQNGSGILWQQIYFFMKDVSKKKTVKT